MGGGCLYIGGRLSRELSVAHAAAGGGGGVDERALRTLAASARGRGHRTLPRLRTHLAHPAVVAFVLKRAE